MALIADQVEVSDWAITFAENAFPIFDRIENAIADKVDNQIEDCAEIKSVWSIYLAE